MWDAVPFQSKIKCRGHFKSSTKDQLSVVLSLFSFLEDKKQQQKKEASVS